MSSNQKFTFLNSQVSVRTIETTGDRREYRRKPVRLTNQANISNNWEEQKITFPTSNEGKTWATANRAYGPSAPLTCALRPAAIARGPKDAGPVLPGAEKTRKLDLHFSVPCASQNYRPWKPSMSSNFSFPKLNATLDIEISNIRPTNIF